MPADAGEHGLGFLVRHPHDLGQRESLGSAGKKEVLRHLIFMEANFHE